jgi:hypothetical protein
MGQASANGLIARLLKNLQQYDKTCANRRPGHRKMARIARPDRDKPILILRTGDVVAARPLGFYQAVGRRLAHQGERP